MNKIITTISCFLFCIIILNSCSLDRKDKKNIKKDWSDIKISDIKDPCDCVPPMITLINSMHELAEENNWKPINDNSDYSKEVIEIQKKMEEIKVLCEVMWNKKKIEEEYINECETFKKWEEHTHNRARKLFEWLDNTANI